jgi:queuine tRNA-ribosyltransferase
MMKNFIVKGLEVQLPIFCPDATKGVVKGVGFDDLEKAGVKGVVVNTYHLANGLGMSLVKAAGGIKKFVGWHGLVISDSGGFQIMSLIQDKHLQGFITERGIHFKKNGKTEIFTPEKSIQMQFALNADIMICLDDFTPVDAGKDEIEKSVEQTISWAKRCKEEFSRQIKLRKITEKDKPKLFAVIQGGDSKKLRARCAKELINIGFDGFGFGGWPMKKDDRLNKEILKFTADLMPKSLPKYALGVGNPQAVIDCFQFGYTIFDCVLPTRDARHKRLLISSDKTYDYLYIEDEKYRRDFRPIEKECDCFTCQHYSRAFVHHLLKIKDPSFFRLATIHNVRFYMRLIESLRGIPMESE